MKKVVALLLAVVTLAAAGGYAVKDHAAMTDMPAPVTLSGNAPALSAHRAILYSPEDGAVLYAKNAGEKAGMASTTKIMTGYLCAQALLSDRERMVKVPSEAVGIEGSSAYLSAGEELRLLDLLYALMLQSANDAAMAIAILLAGSEEAFVEEMNRTAASLSLYDTHFTNPHGLADSDHYTTAYDLARLMAAAMENELFATVVGTKSYLSKTSDSTRSFVNHNRLLSSCEGVYGGKTGFTKATGRCLVSCAKRDGVDLVAVTLDASDDWNDHASLFAYGFAGYRRAEFFKADTFEYSLPVVGGLAAEVICRNAGAASLLTADPLVYADDALAKGIISFEAELPAFVYAPVTAGETVGRIVVRYGDKELASVSLVALSSVEAQPRPLTFWERIRSFFTGKTD